MAFDYPPWLEAQSRQERPTEVYVPLVEGICPVWLHQEGRGCWQAYVASAVKLPLWDSISDGVVAECEHSHDDEATAWECASLLSREVAQAVLDGR